MPVIMTRCLYVLNVEVVPQTEPDSRPTSVGYCIYICADIATHNKESQGLDVLSVYPLKSRLAWNEVIVSPKCLLSLIKSQKSFVVLSLLEHNE
jgi:hypothetical protein